MKGFRRRVGGEGCKLTSALMPTGPWSVPSLFGCEDRRANMETMSGNEKRDATAPQAFLHLLPTPSQALRPGLLLRGALGCAGARVPDGGRAVHRPPAPRPGLGADPRRRRGAAGGLPAEHRSDGGRQLLGPHARDQYRDRDAPQELRPPAEALVPLLRQPEDRAPRGAGDEGSGGDRRGRPPRSGGSLRRGDDLRRRVRPDVHRSTPSWRSSPP